MLTSGLSFILVANEVRSKVTLKVYHMLVPGLRFSQVHVDLVGPLLQSNSFSYLFTINDHSTRLPEAIPLQSTTTKDSALVLDSSFWVPSLINSDRCSQFTGSI